MIHYCSLETKIVKFWLSKPIFCFFIVDADQTFCKSVKTGVKYSVSGRIIQCVRKDKSNISVWLLFLWRLLGKTADFIALHKIFENNHNTYYLQNHLAQYLLCGTWTTWICWFWPPEPTLMALAIGPADMLPPPALLRFAVKFALWDLRCRWR